MKLVFKNWAQFAEFMESLELTSPESMEFELTGGLLFVVWPDSPLLPSASLALTEWFETL